MVSNTEQNILKGCEVITRNGTCGKDKYICGDCNTLIKNKVNSEFNKLFVKQHPKEVYFKQGYQLAQKETAEKVEKLKEEIASEGLEIDEVKHIFSSIDKIFKDNTKKEAEE